MTATLVVQPEAEADLAEGFRWYEAQRKGLGRDFLEAVSRTFERIAEQPLRYAVVHRHARRALLRRFPCVVLYVVREDRVHVLRFCISVATRAWPEVGRAASKRSKAPIAGVACET